MLYTILPGEMMRVERAMLAGTGTQSLALMERAASHVADAAAPYLREGGTLLLACGTGNNGGYGLAAARIVMSRIPGVKTVIWKLEGTPSVETAEQWARLTPWMGRVSTVALGESAPALPAGTVCAVDALFGTGLNRPLTGAARAAAEALNRSGVPVVAVDIPSGLSGVTGYPVAGEHGGVAVRAMVTVTFHRAKPGLFLGDGLDCCGRVIVADIGIPAAWDDAGGMAVYTLGDRLLPPRRRNTHKGDYGRVLVLAGSFGMAGAAALSALAALRAGAGLVCIACPREIVPTVQALCPCATCLPLPDHDAEAAWQALLSGLQKTDALVAGCGLGRGELARGLLARLVPWLCEHRLPAVLDADALNLMAEKTVDYNLQALTQADEDAQTVPPKQPATAPDVARQPAYRQMALTATPGFSQAPTLHSMLQHQQPGERHAPQVAACNATQPHLRLPDCVALTPHIGEAARLLHTTADVVKADQAAAARVLRRVYGGMVALKSASTVLVAADGEAINLYGTPAMAKGGSGDALAGVLGATLAAQTTYGLTGIRLLQTACALHGLAGAVAVEVRGERGMLATDLIDALGRVADVADRGIATLAPLAGRAASAYDTATISMHNTSDEVEELNLRPLDGETPPSHTQPAVKNPRAALGKRVRVTMDRPYGTRHPDHRDTVYQLNYGFVADVLAADNEWQDAYVFGVREPLEVFEGEVIAVIHRLNDVEDKWVVAAPGTQATAEEIRAATAFGERFFKTEIYVQT